MQTDALLAWETYPHEDAFETGERGARAMIEILGGRLKPLMALAKVPVLVSAIHGQTKPPDVCGRDAGGQAARGRGCFSVSRFGAPYLNMPGGGVLVANDDESGAVSLAKRLAKRYWKKRVGAAGDCYPADAVRRGLQTKGGPVLLVETADCCGGGASGDSVHTLRALLAEAPGQSAIVPVVDPGAARSAHSAGLGQAIRLRLGHQLDPQWGDPVEVEGVVTKLSDGAFVYRGGIWDGRAGDMGPTAVVAVGPIQIVISGNATYDWMTEQYDLLDLSPADCKFVVAKNPMNYQQAYAGMMKAAYARHARPDSANTNALPYTAMTGGWFPAVPEHTIDEPEVLCRGGVICERRLEKAGVRGYSTGVDHL